VKSFKLSRLRSAFKHYFDDSEVFEELQEYYDELEYRFEIGENEIKNVVERLEAHGFEVNFVEREEIPEYTVVIGKYEKHADLLKKSVDVIELGDEKALMLKDKVAKEEALDRGEEPDEEWLSRL
ncbi:hypothetical protein AKJ50_00530, partial [candidate division MSBL1 archaeon SCGC-AAA382A13]